MWNSLWPHGLQPARLLCPWNSPSKNIGMGSHSLLQDLPDPGIEPGSPALQANSLLCEPLRKPLLITFLHCLLLFIFIVDRCILLSSISWWVSFLKSECKLLYIICSNHVRWYQGLLQDGGGLDIYRILGDGLSCRLEEPLCVKNLPFHWCALSGAPYSEGPGSASAVWGLPGSLRLLLRRCAHQRRGRAGSPFREPTASSARQCGHGSRAVAAGVWSRPQDFDLLGLFLEVMTV